MSATQLHHLRYDRDLQPWEYYDSDYLILCTECHKEAHDL